MAGFVEVDYDRLDLEPRESVCSACHLVHWTPTGSAYCLEA